MSRLVATIVAAMPKEHTFKIWQEEYSGNEYSNRSLRRRQTLSTTDAHDLNQWDCLLTKGKPYHQNDSDPQQKETLVTVTADWPDHSDWEQ